MMRTFAFFTFFLFIPICLAETIAVKGAGFRYEAKLEAEKITLKSDLVNLSLQKKACNRDIFVQMLKRYKEEKKKIILADKYEKRIDVTQNGKTRSVAAGSKWGMFLYQFPNFMQKAKKSEQILC
jgi:predicted metal-dependent hydrolase